MTLLSSEPVIFFLVSALLSYGLAFPTARVLARFNVVDHPNARSSHEDPTIRGGGIAILSALAIVALFLIEKSGSVVLAQLCAAACILALCSFYDDFKSVSAKVRFGCHAGVALAALAALYWPAVHLRLFPGGALLLPPWLGLTVLFLWLAGYTNAFNFMDGINGIAAGQTVVTGAGMALLTGIATGGWDTPPVLFSLALAGSAAGFLPHNFPRARMFMGDVSSAPLGFLLAALVCWLGLADDGRLFIPLALLHANFVLDTGITLVRRVWRGERWYAAHREHFYQRLIAAGKSHSFVTGLQMGLQLVVLLLMIAYVSSSGWGQVLLATTAVLVWVVFFSVCEGAFRRASRRVVAITPRSWTCQTR